jgi:hypothetical protein
MIGNNFEAFLQSLQIPKACELNKPIFKKMFLDASDGKRSVLDAADKASLKEDVERIRWLYTLKPNTINIAPYKDDEREYPELAVLHIELSNPNRLKRIVHFINRAIPYPLVLLFTCSSEVGESLAVALADKRINQADKEKWVIENSIHTDWINLLSTSEAETAFLRSLKLDGLPFSNFFAFYQALMKRVLALKCAEHSHFFSLEGVADEGSNNRLDALREIEKLGANKSDLANKLKKEKQMGKQVDLNTQIKNINDKIAKIKSSL